VQKIFDATTANSYQLETIDAKLITKLDQKQVCGFIGLVWKHNT